MKNNWLLSAISAAGCVSAKRLTGLIMIVVALICVIILVCTEGGSETVESLLQTIIIVAASLLGISSITGIWKGNKIEVSNKCEKQPQNKDHENDCKCN